jgi:hypothetical protein
MIIESLWPSLDVLSQEYVLVQAWKKTASYIRSHNWYSDTLELDQAAVNLPQFIADLSAKLKNPDQLVNDPLRIVLAPKNQSWQITKDNKTWKPADRSAVKLRPLAHASLKDQVIATGLMLCLADRVETFQGDPRSPITANNRVISYGNRLFCDEINGELKHRWGSGNLYRAYYQDYRSFLSRPETVAEEIDVSDGKRVYIIHSDLRQFYDRVRPELLAEKMTLFSKPSDDPRFFALARRVLDWRWDKKDKQEVFEYQRQAGLPDFSTVALPQGLVASGFFANVVLRDFDESLKQAINKEVADGVQLADACRYVDDLRIILIGKRDQALSEIENIVVDWLGRLLMNNSSGLILSREKTIVSRYKDDERPILQQSRKLNRIQQAVSGGFDAIGGEEILDAVQGLIRAQQRYTVERTKDQGWPFSPIPDVRDETVARFAAGRFRTTCRSLRPLLLDKEETAELLVRENSDEDEADRSPASRTRADLDNEIKAFALGLVENWVNNPSNVRLLRIGLDLWPAPEVLKHVLKLLRPFTEKGGPRKSSRRVAWYCLSEVLRAGATETGFVEDEESLPADLEIGAYRNILKEEAIRLISTTAVKLPWYLKQQALLFLAVSGDVGNLILRSGKNKESKHYRDLIRFLKRDMQHLNPPDFATFAILARRSYRGREAAVELAIKGISLPRLEQIAEKDPSFALEILASHNHLRDQLPPRVRDDLSLKKEDAKLEEGITLASAVLNGNPNGPLRNELTLLDFSEKFLANLSEENVAATITPSNVSVHYGSRNGDIETIKEVKIVPSRVGPANSMYCPPSWCSTEERWRFQLGFLMRFILIAQHDFTRNARGPNWREGTAIYRAPESHWYQRLFGLYNKHVAFGEEWLPITDWTEDLLSALLAWPGCRLSDTTKLVIKGMKATQTWIKERRDFLANMQGVSSSVLLLPLMAPHLKQDSNRPLRACIVQTVFPRAEDFHPSDLELSNQKTRRRHRNHLSAALSAVKKMLDLRETHTKRDGRLDWLILPELSVHPQDIKTHLIPFARAHRTIILAGITYQNLIPTEPLINSALWIIPSWSSTRGLQIIKRRQGKQHLAPTEEELNKPTSKITGFRPCQWLVGYEWSTKQTSVPLWLTAAVCYDATDLRLAADLRHHSDVFAIPALNKDVGTFDQMAMALHYHMFQLVIVANNGQYGGSNAYAPYKEEYTKQLFHLHGQPQASIAFFEIDDIASFIDRKAISHMTPPQNPRPVKTWKSPPAGMS